MNRAVAAGTARGQTTVEPIPAAAHEANRATVKVLTTGAAMATVAVEAAAEAALSWTQATKPLCRRDSQ